MTSRTKQFACGLILFLGSAGLSGCVGDAQDRSVAGAWMPQSPDEYCGAVLTQLGSSIGGAFYGDQPDERFETSGTFDDPDVSFSYGFVEPDDGTSVTVTAALQLDAMGDLLEGTLSSSKGSTFVVAWERSTEAAVIQCTE